MTVKVTMNVSPKTVAFAARIQTPCDNRLDTRAANTSGQVAAWVCR